jgi:formylglycine-generating enzyme required for sulfatase activity
MTSSDGVIMNNWEQRSSESSFTLPMLEWCVIPAGSVVIEGVPCSVPTFYMAKYPVTYAQYEAFVNQGGYDLRTYWTSAGWAWKGDRRQPAYWNDPEWHVHDHPVNGVTWYEAYAFGSWLAKKMQRGIALPTESQWQRAAQGDDGRQYPWGDPFDCTRCNTNKSAIGRTTPVTQYPQGMSPFGVLDLSGNVWEWCLPKWKEAYQLPENVVTEGTEVRVQRGGAFDFSPKDARVVSRDDTRPTNHRSHDGFRVVWNC